MAAALLTDWLFRIGVLTAMHTHTEDLYVASCSGCMEEDVRRKRRH